MTLLPAESPESAAARAALFVNWSNSFETSKLLGVNLADVDSMRRNSSLFAVWVHELDEYRFPQFQFYQGHPFDRMSELLALLPDPSGSGWGQVEWFISHRALLNGDSAVEYLAVGRFDEVLAIAKIEGSDPNQAGW